MENIRFYLLIFIAGLVALLQAHAAEVIDMSERGMQAVHERMAGQSY